MNAFRATFCEQAFDRFTAIYTGAIPDDQQLARQVPQQMPQEVNYLLAADGVLWTCMSSLPLGVMPLITDR